MQGEVYMLIEVIGLSLTDVIQASEGGADRIELCEGMVEDGLTPSFGLIKTAVEAASIPINVMVRPHNKSFVYHENDLKQMLEDVRMIRELGANGIVIGALTEEGNIDMDVVEKLLQEAGDLHVTFHRAFDFAQDQEEALETILQYEQITTILTSGGGSSAFDYEKQLAKLIERTKDTHLEIMPGSGLRVEGLKTFHEKVQSTALHFGTGVRIDCNYDQAISASQIERIRQAIKGIV